MKYSQTKQLSSTKFKRLTGVNRKTYRLMVRIVKGKKALHKKSGRPPELIVEDQVLIKSRKFSLPRRLEIGDCRLQILFGTSPARKWAE